VLAPWDGGLSAHRRLRPAIRDGRLFEFPQAGRYFSGIEDLGTGATNGIDILPSQRGDPRQTLDKI
jgi:hypothetical protein